MRQSSLKFPRDCERYYGNEPLTHTVVAEYNVPKEEWNQGFVNLLDDFFKGKRIPNLEYLPGLIIQKYIDYANNELSVLDPYYSIMERYDLYLPTTKYEV